MINHKRNKIRFGHAMQEHLTDKWKKNNSSNILQKQIFVVGTPCTCENCSHKTLSFRKGLFSASKHESREPYDCVIKVVIKKGETKWHFWSLPLTFTRAFWEFLPLWLSQPSYYITNPEYYSLFFLFFVATFC